MGAIETGTVVDGRYRLEEAIGQGGMGSVWRATHLTLERPVAVKFLETFGSARERMSKRFLREAKIAGSLRHRNVVPILDFGLMGDGQPYMVMELLEGESLGDRMDSEQGIGELELLERVAEMLAGLAAVHEAGIVHRDIKPDNIFLVDEGDGVYARLLDFGVSRAVDPDVGETQMTKTGAVIGTPLYMSPEQARGVRDLDPRSDLWSMGVMIFEGLTGELPFEAENVGDVLIRVVTEDPPRLADRRPDLPPAVTRVVDAVLVRDREGRVESARAMREMVLEAIEALRSWTPSASPPEALVLAAPSAERARPGRRWLAAGVAIGLGAVVLTLGLVYGLTGAPNSADRAAETAHRAPEATEVADRAAPVPQVDEEPVEAAFDEPLGEEMGGDLSERGEEAVEAAPHEANPTEAVPTAPRPPAGRPQRPRPPRAPPAADSASRPASSPSPATEGRPGRFLRDLDY